MAEASNNLDQCKTNHCGDQYWGMPIEYNDEEFKIQDEAFHIKKILDNNTEEQTYDSLFDSLRRLQSMNVSLVTLMVTNIGKSVKALREHKSNDIRHLARTLIDNWITMTDEYLEANAPTEEVPKEQEKRHPPLSEQDKPLRREYCGVPIEYNAEEFGILDDVLHIKKILDNNTEEQTHDSLFDSLRRLQSMNVSLVTLMDTEIGKSVNALRKHKSNDIRHLSRTLINVWKTMTDEWLKAKAPTEEVPKGSENKPPPPSEQDKPLGRESVPQRPNLSEKPKVDGVSKVQQKSDKDKIQKKPVPPPKNVLECNNEPSSEKKSEACKRKMNEPYQETPKKTRRTRLLDTHELPEQNVAQKNQNMSNRTTTRAEANAATAGVPKESGKKLLPLDEETFSDNPTSSNKPPGRVLLQPRPKPVEHTRVDDVTKELQVSDKSTVQKKPVPPPLQNVSDCNSGALSAIEFEACRRKMRERYQKIENGRKQKAPQLLMFHEVPKQNVAQKNQNKRPSKHNWRIAK